MPQMALLLWVNLYMFFTAVFALIIIMNFFYEALIKVSSLTKSTHLISQIWK